MTGTIFASLRDAGISARPRLRVAGMATAGMMALLLSGCAHRAVPVVQAPPPEVMPPRPEMSASLATVAMPAAAPDGGWMTINHGIDAQHAAWHLRAALNVAAIGCRGPADGALVASYNGLLTGQKAALAQINKQIEGEYRDRFGAGWQAEHDRYMTRLYNFFSMPIAKPGFCQTADAIAPQAAALPAGQLAAFAQTALPQLEAPITAVYQQVADTRIAIAAWDARYASRTELAGSAPGAPLPTVPAPSVTVAVPAATPAPVAQLTSKGPRLAYADMGTVMDWNPRPLAALAMR